jgi:hypothetical protein
VERTSLLDRRIREIEERERWRKQVYRQLVERNSLLDRRIREIEERERQRKQVYRQLVERARLLDRRIKEIEEADRQRAGKRSKESFCSTGGYSRYRTGTGRVQFVRQVVEKISIWTKGGTAYRAEGG